MNATWLSLPQHAAAVSMAIRMESRFPIIRHSDNPSHSRHLSMASFCPIHDGIDAGDGEPIEERDYMYRVYAHDPMRASTWGFGVGWRPAGNDRRRIAELMNAFATLLRYSVIYYAMNGWATTFIWADPMACAPPCSGAPRSQRRLLPRQSTTLYLAIIIDPEYHTKRAMSRPADIPIRCCGV